MNIGKINNTYIGIAENGEIFQSEHWHIFSRRLKVECDASAFSTKMDNRKTEGGETTHQKTSSREPEFPKCCD